MRQVLAIIYASPNGKDGWEPVKPEDVPAWVKNPDVIGRLLKGHVAQNNYNGVVLPAGFVNLWYRAERVVTKADGKRLEKVRAKRARRAARNVVMVH